MASCLVSVSFALGCTESNERMNINWKECRKWSWHALIKCQEALSGEVWVNSRNIWVRVGGLRKVFRCLESHARKINTSLLADSMEQSPSWETERFSASQEIPRTSARHLSLSWASSIQSIPPHPTSWRFILILSSQLRLGLLSGLFSLTFPNQNPLYASPPYALHALPIAFSILSPKQYWVITDH